MIQGEPPIFQVGFKSGYHQIRIQAGDEAKIAFRNHKGHYEFMVMPLVLTNAPSNFQSLMNNIVRDHLWKFILYSLTILIYSKDQASHLELLKIVLDILKKNQLVINKKKCTFGQLKLEYLGHIIFSEGVQGDPSKIDNMIS